METMGSLYKDLLKLKGEVDDALQENFERNLPFCDALFDRWERANRLCFGAGASVYDSAYVYGDVRVGEETWIGPNVLLDGSAASLVIGAYCSISAGVQIYTHDSVIWALSGGKADMRTGPVSIGSNCHIGAQAVIVRGVSVGSMCVVGASSLVREDVPDRSIVVGNPARPIGQIVGDGKDIQLVFNE